MSNFLDKWASESEKNKKLCAREGLIIDVTEDILVIMEDKGISKAELSRSLGKSRSFVSQTLSGARNMTLRTLSDICFALDIDPSIQLLNEKKYLINDNKHTYTCWKSEPNVEVSNVIHIRDISKSINQRTYDISELDRAYA